MKTFSRTHTLYLFWMSVPSIILAFHLHLSLQNKAKSFRKLNKNDSTFVYRNIASHIQIQASQTTQLDPETERKLRENSNLHEIYSPTRPSAGKPDKLSIHPPIQLNLHW